MKDPANKPAPDEMAKEFRAYGLMHGSFLTGWFAPPDMGSQAMAIEGAEVLLGHDANSPPSSPVRAKGKQSESSQIKRDDQKSHRERRNP